MNSALGFRFIEAGLLAGALLLAAVLSLWPRRRWKEQADAARGPLAAWIQTLLATLAFPLLALGIGWLALWLPHGAACSWAGHLPALHRTAWSLFWLIMLAYLAGEVTVMRIAAAAGRLPMPALLRGVLRLAAGALAAFFVLRLELGWNITPLLASTALVTAVVGFALQGVLGNLLAGMSLNLTGALAHRDWVVLDDLEGQVGEMNWRETWIVTRENIPVRIPNSKVADARIRNLSRPSGPRRCSVFVDASYDDPPDRVLRELLAAAEAVKEVRKTPAPLAMVLEYKSYGIGYELQIWLDHYPFRRPIMGEVRRHVWYRFRRAGIQIPYPVTDQVLNDFMERAIVPAEPKAAEAAACRRGADLLHSDFARQVLSASDGRLLLPEEELAAWAARLESVPFGRGETVFRQGDEGDCCYVVLSGRLKGRIRHGDGEKETTFETGPGAVVGEMSLMTGLPRTADVTVAESAELLRIPAAEFAELLARQEGLAEQMSRLIADRVQKNRRQFEDLLAADEAGARQALSPEGLLRRFWRLLKGA